MAVQYYLAQSLDGYIAEGNGGLEWLTGFEGDGQVDAPEAGPMSTDGAYDRFFAGVGALAMGSGTYEFILAEARESWPYSEVPSWVFSSRELPVPAGADVRFARGDVRAVVDQILDAAGERNVWVVGGGELATQFADQDLLDELHLTIVPVILGEGISTFAQRLRRSLALTGVRPFRNGMVELRYAVGG